MLAHAPPKFLVPVTGPPLEPICLTFKPGGQSIGRHERCDLKLPGNAERVSRMHARFVSSEKDNNWSVSDMGSRWGTWVNGVRLEPEQRLPLQDADLIAIAPWTFRFSASRNLPKVAISEDSGITRLRSITPNPALHLNAKMLELLMGAIAAFQIAADENQLCKLMMDAALTGTGLQNAFVLRPADIDGSVEVMMSHFSESTNTRVTYSRSLLNAAGTGQVVELSRQANDISQSIVAMHITAAICIPIMLDSTLSHFLYLDAREDASAALPAHSADFCVTLGRMASLALSHFKRMDIERRQAEMNRDLAAAAAAQRWILPRRINQMGRFLCVGESRAGQDLSGDFFDLIYLPGERVAITLGDVAGKGVAASVLMTAAQGFLHAAMLEHGDPAKAMTSLNQYVSQRSDDSRFVTLWMAVLDPIQQTLSYVNGGHGYAFLQPPSGELHKLDAGEGLPIGVDERHRYTPHTVPLPENGRLLIVSDGIIEQFGFDPSEGETANIKQFGVSGVTQLLTASLRTDTLADVFAAVEQHANSKQLADDATAVLISW